MTGDEDHRFMMINIPFFRKIYHFFSIVTAAL